jgi:hypothetical protein
MTTAHGGLINGVCSLTSRSTCMGFQDHNCCPMERTRLYPRYQTGFRLFCKGFSRYLRVGVRGENSGVGGEDIGGDGAMIVVDVAEAVEVKLIISEVLVARMMRL